MSKIGIVDAVSLVDTKLRVGNRPLHSSTAISPGPIPRQSAMELLNHQKQILSELFDRDGLLIMGRGLGLHAIVASFVSIHNTSQNLVILVNMKAEDGDRLSQIHSNRKDNLDAGNSGDVVGGDPIKNVTGLLNSNER